MFHKVRTTMDSHRREIPVRHHPILPVPALLILVAALACYSPPAPPGSQTPAVSREQALAEIQEFVKSFNATYAANDLDAYWSYYAPELTQFYPEGRMDLADYQTYWNKHIADGNRLTEVRYEDMVIHLGPSNDAAVAQYRIFTRTAHPDGSTAEEWSQESDVMFRRDGKWQVVQMHYSPAPKEATGGAATP